MQIERSSKHPPSSRLAAIARKLLDDSKLCAIATVSPSGRAHINTAYFAWSRAFDVVWLSDSHAHHSRNLRANDRVAIAVYDSSQTWGGPDRGIQLFGSAHEVAQRAARHAEHIYANRFSEYGEADLGSYRFYCFRPRRVKLFDEPVLGPGVFVTARVRNDGGVTWERTEIYRERSE
jgi:uncharacterized protein YhbP (UPF0306 family)